jgi:hypothetical protein
MNASVTSRHAVHPLIRVDWDDAAQICGVLMRLHVAGPAHVDDVTGPHVILVVPIKFSLSTALLALRWFGEPSELQPLVDQAIRPYALRL